MSNSRPFKSGFYNAKKWQKSIIDHYSKSPKFYGEEVLTAPVVKLTESVAMVFVTFSSSPELVGQFLAQTTNPLFDKGQYQKEVYGLLKQDPQATVGIMADALMFIRQCFLQDKIVLPNYFQKEIDLVTEATPALKFLRFSEAIKTITKVHIEQLTHMIAEGDY